MRRTKQEAEQTRLMIIKTAIRVFGEKGYSATRLSDIAHEANVTRGAIYWHFSNKEELFIEILQDRIKPFFVLIDSIIAADLNPLEKIRRIMLDVAYRLVDDEDFKANQKLEFIETSMLDDADGIDEYIDRNVVEFGKRLGTVIEEGQQKGEIRADVDIEVMLYVLNIYMRGMSFLLAHGEDVLLERRLPSVVELIMELFMV